MGLNHVYAKLQQQLDKKLPFVVYAKPNSTQIISLLQHNDVLHETNNHEVSGFIFAPFDNSKKSIVIPNAESESHEFVRERSLAGKEKKNYFQKSDEYKNHHKELVKSGIKAINDGILRKVVLSRKEEVEIPENKTALTFFDTLVQRYATAFVYLWYHPKVGTWLGATPETLLQIKNDHLFTMSLAGTQLYSKDEETIWGNKEIEEQYIVTEFIVDALSAVSDDIIASEAYTHRAGTLVHLRSDIQGQLRVQDGVTIEKVIHTLHPTPAVCGMPKEEAKSFILSNEGYDRKFYTGFLGELNMAVGQDIVSNLFVNLRCMEMEEDKINLYIGGGITKDSDPEKEWEETVRKTATMKHVLL